MSVPSPPRRRALENAFRARYGGPPSVVARAPGRVDLMGSHTDYNNGCVLTMAIDRDTWIAARRRADARVVVRSVDLDREAMFGLDVREADSLPGWSRYVAGVAWTLADDGVNVGGADLLIQSTVPIGAGLSSSAALECATATAFEALGGIEIDPVRKARLCQAAEQRFAGVQCGILDQYTSVLGCAGMALVLDCRDLTSRTAALPDGVTVVVADTKAPRMLADSEYGARRAQCEAGARAIGVGSLRELDAEAFDARSAALDPVVRRRCRFVVDEQARVLAMASAFERHDQTAIRALAEASFRGAGALYEVVVPPMTAMYDVMAAAPGYIGARQAGAGFGGCLVALVGTQAVPSFVDAVREGYRRRTGIDTWITEVEPVAGASVVQ